jgi:hypothetical protein
MPDIIKGCCLILLFLLTAAISQQTSAQNVAESVSEKLIYHHIKTDVSGKIIPWYNEDPGKSYSHIIQLLWNFWDTMRRDMNGIPYYMNHQVWRPDHNDPRGLGGDQLAMALSSWRLLYAYKGNEQIKENMKFIADYYLSHGLSPSECVWPDIPFPYNTLVYSGIYDGDMVIGKDFTQPDKAGSFGIELLQLFKMMNKERYPHATDKRYLQAAIAIANTLAKHVRDGDENNSPLPFKVNAITGEVGKLKDNAGSGKDAALSSYTTNWSGTLLLFKELTELQQGNTNEYKAAFDKIIAWMKKYPLQNNKWGPFFEDVPGWSDTQINAVTFAQFMMNNRKYFPDWKTQVQKIFDWVYEKLGNDKWKKYGMTVVNEQTVYQTPGNSHTSRQASAELQYMQLTGNWSRLDHATRQLNWATYMVDTDGKNRYPQDENWLTDGYGDYIRHYLRAMTAAPQLAPADEVHLLSSTSVIQQADYRGNVNKFIVPDVRNMDVSKVLIYYRAYDKEGTEQIRMPEKPSQVLINNKHVAALKESSDEGFIWTKLNKGGLLTVHRKEGNSVIVLE